MENVRLCIVFCLLLCFGHYNLDAQPIPNKSLIGNKALPLLQMFEKESIREGYMPDGIGIFYITRYNSPKDGLELWNVKVVLDDRYKDQPPLEYSQIGENFYFFYDITDTGIVNGSTVNSKAINYLDSIVSSRLYPRLAAKKRLVNTIMGTEVIKTKSTSNKNIVSLRNSITIAFLRDGSVRTSRPFREE